MIEIPTKYEPSEKESKWYAYWMKNEFFKSIPDDREPFTIVIPPPNVTGVLHMGHMLNNTIQDILVRRARMSGYNACWVPGTDHASIATEAKVVAKLKDEGIDKNSISRDEFMKHAWEWKEKHGGIILEQLKTLGASCDWDRTRFTMDKELYDSVIKVFIDLYQKGNIYRGIRMVNWDPAAQTAVSDEEVIYKEEQSKLYYLKYKLVGEDGFITIATTRPETILGDTAVCVNPNDERFEKFKGKKVIVPLINREVPVIQDDYVDMEFGTGALKITPAHDIHDYEIGQKYNLPSIDIFNDDGTLSDAAGMFIGKDRFDVRKLITEKLKESGGLDKIEDYVNKVGFSERTNAAIEPKLSMQWFLKMDKLSKPALDNVMNDTIKFFPSKFKNVYRHWMENIKDWNISRQLWWGQQIPAYYLPNSNDFVVAANIDDALKLAIEKTGNKDLSTADLRQDEDVLDTWFSSWLWPISVFNGINEPGNKEINYYYPTNDLVTGHDIIFFWIARMIISGYEYRNELPFRNVYFTGMVRDKQGRKMSKQLGNSPDPIRLMKKYGADGVRIGMLLCSPAGGDLLYDDKLPEQGRNFGNKIWNAFRLVKQWEVDTEIEQPQYAKLAVEWFDNKLKQTIELLDKQFESFRISEAVMTVYRFFWDEFSSWYLEMIKPAYQKPIDAITLAKTNEFFDKTLRILHPFMPFITEEIWQLLEERKDGESIMVSSMPKADKFNIELLNSVEDFKELITGIRKIRAEKNIPNREAIELIIKQNSNTSYSYFNPVLQKLANLSKISTTKDKVDNAASLMVKTTEYYIPLADIVDAGEEIKKLEAELKHYKGFLLGVEKKLGNQRFVNNAPAKVVEIEKKKQSDAQSKIKIIEERIASLKK